MLPSQVKLAGKTSKKDFSVYAWKKIELKDRTTVLRRPRKKQIEATKENKNQDNEERYNLESKG